MLPYKTEPILVEKVWGGDRLRSYNKDISGKIGESLEYNGEKDGIPLAIKLIDACDNLSIQVHPSKEAAMEQKDGERGKDELWVVLDCYEDSVIYLGFNEYYEKKTIKEAAIDGSIINMLNKIKVKKGDCFFIPAGTIHALGKGVLVYELQQSSDVTYRLYDWERAMKGQKRELHIDKAIQSLENSIMKTGSITNIYDKLNMECRLVCIGQYDHFGAIFISLKNEESIMQRCDETRIITVVSGKGMLCCKDKKMVVKKGDTIVIPEDTNGFVSIISSGTLRYIESRQIGANLKI